VPTKNLQMFLSELDHFWGLFYTHTHTHASYSLQLDYLLGLSLRNKQTSRWRNPQSIKRVVLAIRCPLSVLVQNHDDDHEFAELAAVHVHGMFYKRRVEALNY